MACVPRKRLSDGEVCDLLQAVIDQKQRQVDIQPRRTGREERQGKEPLSSRPSSSQPYSNRQCDGDGGAVSSTTASTTFTGHQTVRNPIGWQRDAWIASLVQQHARLARPGDLVTRAHWDFVEACEYWNAVILPPQDEKQTKGNRSVETSPNRLYRVFRPKPSLFLDVIITALSYHISALYRHRDIPVAPTGSAFDLKAIWSDFYHYMGLAIQSINKSLTQAAFPPNTALFHLIIAVTSAEVFLSPISWRAHVEGFLALLQVRGGTKKVIEGGECSGDVLVRVMVYSIMANTTSPANNQIQRTAIFTVDDFHELYSGFTLAYLPCPTVVFLQIRSITNLRVQVAAGSTSESIWPSVSEILKQLDNFTTKSWTEKYTLPENPVGLYLAADVFKTATALYALLSLPLPPTAPIPSLYDQSTPGFHQDEATTVSSGRVRYRTMLLHQIRAAWAMLPRMSGMAWPLAVASVAVADAPEEQSFVADSLQNMGRNPDYDPGPLCTLAKAKALWASKKTGWEDCFYEPATVLA